VVVVVAAGGGGADAVVLAVVLLAVGELGEVLPECGVEAAGDDDVVLLADGLDAEVVVAVVVRSADASATPSDPRVNHRTRSATSSRTTPAAAPSTTRRFRSIRRP
jgi:hypothetical protein